MSRVDVDLADDRFDVRYDPERVEPAELLELVRELGYEPELASAKPLLDAPLQVELATLPTDLRTLFERARATQRPILLDFGAPG